MLSSRVIPLNVGAQQYPSKTPGRLKSRVENAIHPTTVNGKGKEISKTPFHPATIQKDHTQGKPAIVTTRSTVRPLGDKTPFPNRIGNQQFLTPLLQSAKFTAPSFLDPDTLIKFEKTPESLLRPSSLRKHVRVPRSASKSFETPLNKGHHWDISEASIVIAESEVQETIVEDDYDEVEYMPPNTLDLPYQPPVDFDIPNYKEVGKSLFKLAHSYPYDDSPPVEITADEEAGQVTTWDMLALPELDNDDPFHQPASIPKHPKASDARPPIPSKMSLHARAATRNTKTQGTAVAPKVVPVAQTTTVKRIPSVGLSAATTKTTANRTTRAGTSASIPAATTVLPASRSALRTNPLKGSGPSANNPLATAPVVKQISSLKAEAAGSVSRRRGPPKSTTAAVTANTQAIPPHLTIPNATVTRGRVAGTAAAATTQPIRRPINPALSSKLNTTTKTSSFHATAKIGGPAARKRMSTALGEDPGIDVVVIRSSLEPQDDFRFDV